MSNLIPATVKYDSKRQPWIVVQTNKQLPWMQGYTQLKSNIWRTHLTPANYRNIRKQKGVRKFKAMENYPYYRPPFIKPRVQQGPTAEFLVGNKRGWCLNGMRSGKTLSAGWAMDFLFLCGAVNKALVMAPLTIIHDVWEPALLQIAPSRPIYVASGSIDELLAVIARDTVKVIVINHDKLKLAFTALDEGFDPDLVITDETGGFRAITSDRTKSMQKFVGVPGPNLIARKARRRFWPLTASPNPQKPTDVWPLARCVNPDSVPVKFNDFRDLTMYSPNMGKWEPRRDWLTHVEAALVPSICYATEDCIDLPPQEYVMHNCPFTPKQTKAMKELIKSGITWLDQIQSKVGDPTQAAVLAQNAAVRLIKILQIAGGVVRDENGTPRVVAADNRIKLLKDVIDQSMIRVDSKFIIMCVYTALQPYIAKKLKRAGYDSVIINGQVTSAAGRKRLLDEWRNQVSKRVLILHPEVGQYGLDLSEANHIAWYIPTFKTTEFIQGNARTQAEASSKKRATYVHMLEGSWQERKIYRDRQQQNQNQTSTIDLFRGLVHEMDGAM